MKLSIATAQFPVSKDIRKNAKYIIDLSARAKKLKADIVHFSETCLGGYAGSEFASWDGYDWQVLQAAEEEVKRSAKSLKIGIIYGTNRKVSADDYRNSLIYISKEGKREARYDKRFCTSGDLKYYTSGKQFAVFTLKGFKCGMLICYDVRFPELYRAYKKKNVQIAFHSFYNARAKGANIHTVIMRTTLQARAATNYMYISANNSAGYYQSWPSVFVRPDGTISASCRQNRTDLIISEISDKDTYYDASEPYRDRAMKGILYSE